MSFATLTPQYHPQLRQGWLCNRQGAEEPLRMVSPSFLSRAHILVIAAVPSGVSLTAERPHQTAVPTCNFLRL